MPRQWDFPKRRTLHGLPVFEVGERVEILRPVVGWVTGEVAVRFGQMDASGRKLYRYGVGFDDPALGLGANVSAAELRPTKKGAN